MTAAPKELLFNLAFYKLEKKYYYSMSEKSNEVFNSCLRKQLGNRAYKNPQFVQDYALFTLDRNTFNSEMFTYMAGGNTELGCWKSLLRPLVEAKSRHAVTVWSSTYYGNIPNILSATQQRTLAELILQYGAQDSDTHSFGELIDNLRKSKVVFSEPLKSFCLELGKEQLQEFLKGHPDAKDYYDSLQNRLPSKKSSSIIEEGVKLEVGDN